ncbi:MAG: GntR family transcriptional regulator [Rhizobiaceae bacterium]|nr:GntR family transcriptional regulator [Rhizobiaceae bacterium]
MKQHNFAEKLSASSHWKAPGGDGIASAERYSDKAYDILRDRLVRLHYAPMQPLNERSLTVDLEIGLAPIREALRRLEGDHLVVIYPRRGIFAAEIGLRDQQSIKEVRVEIEGLAAALAAARATAQERKALVEFAESLYREPDVDRRMSGDEAFHRRIYAMARNAFLEPTLIQQYGLAIRLWYFCALNSWMPDIAPVADHRELAAAISLGDSERARDLLREHVQQGSDKVRDLLFKAIEQ